MLAQDMIVREGQRILPRGAPSWGAKLCSFLQLLTQPGKVKRDTQGVLHYYELPLPVTMLGSVVHFRVEAHSLPFEQGGKSANLRQCTFGTTTTVGNERHCVFDCPYIKDLRQQHVLAVPGMAHFLPSFNMHSVSSILMMP